MCHRVAHAAHHDAGTTRVLVPALVAAAVVRLTRAGKGRQGAFNHADYRAYRDIFRGAAQLIATRAALLTRHHASITQFQKDGLQELQRNGLFGSDRMHQNGTLAIVAAEWVESFQGVLSLL